MGLKNTFVRGVNTVFAILKDAVKKGQYIVVTDDGFDESSEVPHDVRVILDRFSQEDVEYSSFYDLIQPTDTKGMIPGEDLPVAMNTANTLTVEGRKFAIVAFETDPMEALFTLLLRDSK
jgi:hypothetical protein